MTTAPIPDGDLVRSAPPAPPAALAVFGARLHLAEAYAARLTTDGVLRGLIGPREAPRLWVRHLLNCAALSDLLPAGARVVDVGSGAGLPGIVLAIRRPDLQVDLVEPMQRRTDFLTEVVAELGLANSTRVIHGRAEDPAVRDVAGDASWVVARAVAPLDRLVRWCLPLLGPDGRLLALKGERAADEVSQHRAAIRRSGAARVAIEQVAVPGLDEPVGVVVVERAPDGARGASRRAHR